MKFEAFEVSADYDEYDNLIIYFGADSHYLMIQYTDDPDEQDIKSGMDTYYIERDDQGYSGYGGIKSWEITNNSLHIHLDEKGTNHLKTDNIQITFSLERKKFDDLRTKLEKALN